MITKTIELSSDEIQPNRTLLVGPSFLGKTYLMLQIFSRLSNRDIYTITKPTPEQYSNSNIKIKEIEESEPLSEYENAIISEYENAIIVFDDILGSSNSRYIDQFFIRGRHKNLDIYYLSQSCFDLPERTIRNNSTKIIQTIKGTEKINRDVAG